MKKAKSNTSHKEAGKGVKFAQQSGEKELLNESLAKKGDASSKDKISKKTFEKPQEEGKAFEKSPTISEGEKKAKDIVEKRKAGKKKANKPLKKKAKRDTSYEQGGKGDKSTQKSGEKEVLHESLAEKGEASLWMQKGKNPSYEDEEVDHNDNRKEGEEERMISEFVKAVPKRNKPSLKSEGHQGTEQKDARSNVSAASEGEKTISSIKESLLQQVCAETCEGCKPNRIAKLDTVIKEVVVELHSASVEFAKLQAKHQPTKDDSSPSFSPISAVAHPNS
ncbi:hypothetical protein Cgig2_024097 [Carnegiea gigantea]|uniref:Uncharacterized protein n=1 Tax=Carnegiea gigantea TaxID=171969 RepID=A0A9Q1GN87_9CARY|nr:hypothetical protein Cgig2_024097 [Carnegiea gigantea]